jgi:hypothetical protein
MLMQGSLTKGKVSVQLISLYQLISCFLKLKIVFTFVYKTSYLNEEVNCTEPSPSVGVPCCLDSFKISAPIWFMGRMGCQHCQDKQAALIQS